MRAVAQAIVRSPRTAVAPGYALPLYDGGRSGVAVVLLTTADAASYTDVHQVAFTVNATWPGTYRLRVELWSANAAGRKPAARVGLAPPAFVTFTVAPSTPTRNCWPACSPSPGS